MQWMPSVSERRTEIRNDTEHAGTGLSAPDTRTLALGFGHARSIQRRTSEITELTYQARTILGVSCCIALLGCERDNDRSDQTAASSGWSQVTSDATPSVTSMQRAAAEEARSALLSSLMTELTKALQEDGPKAGIEVCAERAPVIAAEISASHGVNIGRTSFRLRNPENRPPEWATDVVTQRAESPVSFQHDDGRFATLRLIHVAPNCLMCHGTPEQLAPGVPAALAANYPSDRATGFAEGDLRGWFWVEVPNDKGDD